MHIAIVLDCYYDKGNGTSISARNCVRELLSRGHEVTVLCTESETGEKVGGENIVEFKPLKVPVFQRLIDAQHGMLAKINEGRICRAFRGVDIVHVYLPMFLGTCCVKIANLLNIPVLGCYHMSAQNVTYNAHMKHIPGATSLTYDILRLVHYSYPKMRDIYCPSRHIARVLLSHGYRQNLHVISNGYDPMFSKSNEEYQNNDGKLIITCVGRYTKEKRQDLIIRAVAKSKYCDKIELHFAGKGARASFYKRLARRYKVDLKTEYLDREQLKELLNKSYLYVQASDVETEGVACLEAIACGVVPIISDAPMCATQQFALCENSRFGHGKARELAKRIDYWIEHRRARNNMSSEYANFAKKFSLNRHIDSLICVYQSIISRNGDNRYIVQDYNNNFKIEFACGDESKCLIPSPRLSRRLARILRSSL